MALSANEPRKFRGVGNVARLPVAANAHVFVGSALEENGSGGVEPSSGAGTFMGFAIEEADNNPGALDDKQVDVQLNGLVELTVAHTTTWAQTDIGATVYASDDGTFTNDSTGNMAIGKVVSIISGIGAGSGQVLVFFESVPAQSL